MLRGFPRGCADRPGEVESKKIRTTMPRFLSFLKTTILGGALVVLPAWLALLLLFKAVMQLQVFVKPVSSHLPESVGHPRVIAVLVILALCFAVGALIRTALGRNVKATVETTVLEKLPGYTMLRNVGRQMTDLEQNHGFKPALVEIEDALAPCFVVEEHEGGGLLTVFIPFAPTPAAGSILIVAAARVHPVNVSVAKMFQCVTKWGAGTGELLAARRTAPAPGGSGGAGNHGMESREGSK